MGISSHWAKFFFDNREIIFSSRVNSEWLTIGCADYNDTNDSISRTVSKLFLSDELYKSIKADKAYLNHKLHKTAISRLVSCFGYSKYYESDINSRGDYVFDLNKGIDEKFQKKFDLIYDNGTLEHIFNPIQGLKNMYHLVNDDGLLIHSQGIGDQTDHGYWTFNPGLLLDFYNKNGGEVLGIYILDNDGWYGKLNYVGVNIHGVLGYLPFTKQIKTGVRIILYSIIKSLENILALRKVNNFFKFILKSYATFPNYSMIAIFRIKSKNENIQMTIQNSY